MMRRRTSGAEALGARLLVHVGDVAALLAQAVAHAVIAREIGRGLRRRDDVIGRQRIARVRQRDLDDLGAGVAQPGDALLPQRIDLGDMPSMRYSFGMPMRRPFTEAPIAAS